MKNHSQGLNDTITEHLKNITKEAENMVKDVGTKMKQIEGKIVFQVAAVPQQSMWILNDFSVNEISLFILCKDFILQLVSDLEKRIQDAVQNKMNKMKELDALLTETMSLRQYIVDKVNNYLQCGT